MTRKELEKIKALLEKNVKGLRAIIILSPPNKEVVLYTKVWVVDILGCRFVNVMN